MAMVSGKLAAETIVQARGVDDFSAGSLQAYTQALQDSFVFKDLKKYKQFPNFLQKHKEIFTVLPSLSAMAARDMLTVDGETKKSKQSRIWKTIRHRMSVLKLLRLMFDAWRSVK